MQAIGIYNPDVYAWRRDAACLGVDPVVFFGDRDITDPTDDDPTINRKEPGRHQRVKLAKSICAGCVVKTECLEWALIYQPHGICGGMTERERQKESRRRRRDGQAGQD